MLKDGYRLLPGNVNNKFSVSDTIVATFFRAPVSSVYFVYLSLSFDIIIILATIWGIAASLTFDGQHELALNVVKEFLFMMVVLILFEKNNLYKIERIENFQKSWASISSLWIFSSCLVAAVVFLTMARPTDDLFIYAYFFVAGHLGILGERFLLSRLFRYCVEKNIVAHRVVTVGSTALAHKFASHIKDNRFGVKIGAIFDDGWIEDHAQSGVTLSKGAGLDAISQYCKSNSIDTIVITLPVDDSERLQYLIQQLSVQPVNLRIFPGALMPWSDAGCYASIGDIPGVQLMTVANRPIDNWGIFAKFLMDRIGGIFALVLFGPVMLACAIGIKLSSPGPILYRQKRIGYRNELFEVYKFRSMHVNCCDTGKLTERGDKRVYRFGQIMRSLSLDELPQIFNVLKGDMSLVGPRPHMPEARAAGQLYCEAVTEYALRHRVKPGITGWAQINGWRGPTEAIEQIKNRVACDLYYINNWSLSFDLVILVKTIFVGFFGKNSF
ncbi:MAG TPA: undecaprenyl-phosphate glucose phosphotransferase [Acidocella sp.]|nr:undecaprenyl-phosphate glucose phosphotransferase [Acidocella sp.]